MNMADQVLDIANHQPLVRPRDLEAQGISREHLLRLYRRGLLRRIARGVYTLVEATVPSGTICLLSALRFHGLTTQDPHEVWLAIGNKARRPAFDFPPVRTVRFSGLALSEGIEHHVVEGVRLAVYGAAKTVADCFKYRNKLGIDIAIEALRDSMKQRKTTIDEIHRYAKICRVARVIRPYLESIA